MLQIKGVNFEGAFQMLFWENNPGVGSQVCKPSRVSNLISSRESFNWETLSGTAQVRTSFSLLPTGHCYLPPKKKTVHTPFMPCTLGGRSSDKKPKNVSSAVKPDRRPFWPCTAVYLLWDIQVGGI